VPRRGAARGLTREFPQHPENFQRCAVTATSSIFITSVDADGT